VNLQGIEPDSYFRIVPLREGGRRRARLGAQDVVIGTDLGTDLGVTVGDKLNLRVASPGATLTVSGLVDPAASSSTSAPRSLRCRRRRRCLGLPGGVSAIDVTVHDIYAAEDTAQQIRASTGIDADS
jgi:lipoprotein-releasing system permease protein